jgi:DNA-directed RNA polymerase specialized sigma24 family protein
VGNAMGRVYGSSEELYDGCLGGSTDAWNEAGKYVYSILYGFCNQLSEDDRNDIVNDTLMYFLSRGLKEIDNPKAFKKLLKLKAKGLAIDRLRKDAGIKIQDPPQDYGEDDSPLSEYFPPSWDNSEQKIFTNQALKICSFIVDSLKKECREILPLYFKYKVGGEGIGQLAEDLMKPLSFVATSVHRCLKKLYTHPQIIKLREDIA